MDEAQAQGNWDVDPKRAWRLAELRAARYERALRILAGLPDDLGVTHGAELHDEGDRTCYARGVLAGADRMAISEAIERGSKP